VKIEECRRFIAALMVRRREAPSRTMAANTNLDGILRDALATLGLLRMRAGD
jgi:hypothetical protein